MMTTLHMLQEQSPNKLQMMSFVLQTKEGGLVVIDGGERADAAHLQETLIRLGGSEPVVDLWILTHPHTDHIDALLEIFSKPNPIRVKKICDHFVSEEFYRTYESYEEGSAQSLHEYNEWKAKCPEMFLDLEAGQKLTVGSAEITVLYVPDESITVNAYNNSSVVFRVDAEGQRILFTGDLGEEAGDRMLATVPQEELRAEIVQMAHHGQNGVKKSFYEAVSPKACLWNTPVWLWENNAGEGYNTGPWRTVEVRGWMDELSVKKHFVSKDGDHVLELPYRLDKDN